MFLQRKNVLIWKTVWRLRGPKNWTERVCLRKVRMLFPNWAGKFLKLLANFRQIRSEDPTRRKPKLFGFGLPHNRRRPLFFFYFLMRQVICSLGLHQEFPRGSQTYSSSQNFIIVVSVYSLNKSFLKIQFFYKDIH